MSLCEVARLPRSVETLWGTSDALSWRLMSVGLTSLRIVGTERRKRGKLAQQDLPYGISPPTHADDRLHRGSGNGSQKGREGVSSLLPHLILL